MNVHLVFADVAKSLSLSTATIRSMIFKGELMAYRLGVSGRIIRILKSDVDAMNWDASSYWLLARNPLRLQP